MAKKTFRIKDKQGNDVDYVIPASRVVLDSNTDLDEKIGDIEDDIDEVDGSSVKRITFNGGTPVTPDEQGNVSLNQAKADWTERNSNSPKFIENKPDIVEDVFYEEQTRTFKKNKNGTVSEIMTLPEQSATVVTDSAMSESSENPVQNKVIKAYVDAVSARIDILIGSGNVQGAIDTFNEVVAFLNGINSSDTLAAKLALKANDADVVKTISVNGGTPATPVDGNVDISVSGGSASQEISILFVGNSLMQDAVSYLPLVLKEVAPDVTFKFYMWYDAGTTLSQLLTKWGNSGTAEIFSTCENVTSWTNANNTQTMGAFLASGKTFDIVVLEEYFNLMTENGYTAANKQAFNDVIAYIRNHYNKPFKVVSFFHRPRTNAYGDTADLAIADEVFGLTYEGVRWQLENTISEGVLPAGIAAYRAMYDSVLNELGSAGYMSPDGTHAQEGLPSLMQAWVSALWVLDELSIPASINNVQGRVTSANWSSINVPGPNPWDSPQNNIVVGTSAQDMEAMDIAIKAYKEGKRLEMNFISPNGIPAYKIEVAGGSGTQTERTVRLYASVLPADAADRIVWSIVSGDATVSDGVVTYNGSSTTATVVVRAKIDGKNLKTDTTLSFSVSSVATPVFTPPAGEIVAGTTVAISCATAGATIYYTTDGSTPTSASTQYSSPITVNGAMTIKAIAVLGNESSNVGTAVYNMPAPKTVTISVSDGTNAVEGATVVLNDGTNDITPTSQGSGSYIFSVMAGTYTLSVSKTGFATYTEQMTISSDTSKAVVLRSSSLMTHAILANANFMGHTHNPIMASIMPASADPNALTNDGAYIQLRQPSRSSIIIPREDADVPVTWQSWKGTESYYGAGENLDNIKAAYSLVEWPLDVNEIEIKLTNSDYWIGGRIMSKSNADLVQITTNSYDQGGNSCVYRLSRADYPNAFYIALWFKYLEAGSSWNNPSLQTLGLSINAVD